MSLRRGAVPRGFSRAPSVPTSATGGGLGAVSSLAIGFAVIVSVVAAAGVAVSTGLWADNVHTLDAKADSNRDAILDLEAMIAAINDTFFLDSEWTMANAADQTKRFMFNGTLISTMTKRNYAWPDTDGIVVLETTLPPTNASFSEDEFSVYSFASPSIDIQFDLSMLTFARTYFWPNKGGTVAMLSDVIQIAGNTSVFLDSAFAIENDPDTTKRAMFDASQISTMTNRTVTFDDFDGTMCLLEPPQTLTNKTLDNSNNATLLTTGFTLQDDADPSKQLLFDLSALSGGVDLTATLPAFGSTSSRELMFTTGTQLVTGAKTFDDTALMIRDSATTNEAQFNCTLLSTDQDYQLPDDSGVLVLEAASQTLSNKTLGVSNTITVLDSQLTVQNDGGNGSNTVQFDLTNVTQPQTLSAPDKSGTIALVSDLPVWGTWSPSFSSQSGWTLTPSTVAGAPIFVRIGNKVMCWLTINGLRDPGSTQTLTLRFTLPISPGGNFVGSDGLAGVMSDERGQAGIAQATPGTELARIQSRNPTETNVNVILKVNFAYTIQ